MSVANTGSSAITGPMLLAPGMSAHDFVGYAWHAVQLDGARVKAELNDPTAIRKLAADIAEGRADQAHERARELLERSA